MKNHVFCGLGTFAILGFSVLCISWGGVTRHARGARPQAIAFDELRMHVEVDLAFARSADEYRVPLSLDFPAEVVLEATSKSCFTALRVKDCSGKTVLDVGSPNAQALGVSDVEVGYEGTLRDVLKEFAPGVYSVEAIAVDGTTLAGVVTLSGGFPGFFTVVSPRPADVVPFDDVTIVWTASRGAARYVLEVEQEETGFSMEVKLPPSQTSFTLPKAALEPDRSYEYSLAVEGDTDNELEIEGRFLMAGSGPAFRGAAAR